MITCDLLVGEMYEVRRDGVLVATATGRPAARLIVEALEAREPPPDHEDWKRSLWRLIEKRRRRGSGD